MVYIKYRSSNKEKNNSNSIELNACGWDKNSVTLRSGREILLIINNVATSVLRYQNWFHIFKSTIMKNLKEPH